MSDLLVNPGTGDLSVEVGGIVRLTMGVAEVTRQDLKIALSTFLGECFLDTQIGVPYYRDILVKNPNLDLIKVLLRRKILSRANVVSVPRLDLEFVPSERRLFVDFDAVISDGSTVSIVVGEAEQIEPDTGPDELIILMV